VLMGTILRAFTPLPITIPECFNQTSIICMILAKTITMTSYQEILKSLFLIYGE
jgi:hypothetical protein